jgi:hypothetical protein
MPDGSGEKSNPKQTEEVRLNLVPSGDPKMGRVYVNYAQVSHSPWEFTIRFGLAPTGADIEQTMKKGQATLEVPTIIDIMIPPTLMPGLIRALQTNFDKFDKKQVEKTEIDSTQKTQH